MKNTSSKGSTNEQAKETKTEGPEVKKQVDDTISLVSEFETAIHKAKVAQTITKKPVSIEVTQEVFDHFMHGQNTPYFFYKDIRVYLKGTKDEIEKQETVTTNQKLFGSPN